MATATQIDLASSKNPAFSVAGITLDATKNATAFLNEDMHRHHVVFNRRGYHNHIPHSVLTNWVLGATAEQLRIHYEANRAYNHIALKPSSDAMANLSDPATFVSSLSTKRNYQAYLAFFQGEIEKKGWKATLNEYLFGGDDRASAMLARTYSGFYHALIHIGFGIEFQQPAVLAEGLAMTASERDELGDYLRATDQKSASTPSKPLAEILDLIRSDSSISCSSAKLIELASQYKVDPAHLDDAVKESVNFSAYIAAATYNKKGPEFNFTLMHCINTSIFLQSFAASSGPLACLAPEHAAKIVEWKSRADLYLFVQFSPLPFDVEYVRTYKPKQSDGWDAVIARAIANVRDDGHLTKLIRALANGERLCGDGIDRPTWGFTGKDIWLNAAHMALDSLEHFDAASKNLKAFEDMTE